MSKKTFPYIQCDYCPATTQVAGTLQSNDAGWFTTPGVFAGTADIQTQTVRQRDSTGRIVMVRPMQKYICPACAEKGGVAAFVAFLNPTPAPAANPTAK